MIHRDFPIQILSMRSETKSAIETKYSRLKRIDSAVPMPDEESVFIGHLRVSI